MAINKVSSTDVLSHADVEAARQRAAQQEQMSGLMSLLMHGQQSQAGIAAQGEQARQTQAAGEALKQGSQDRNVNTLQKLLDANPNAGASVNGESVGVTRPVMDPSLNPMAQVRQQMLEQGKQENLSKRYEKINNFTSALQDIEDKTSQANGGKGGIITNPDAKLVSTGKVMSALPTQAVGLGEMLGAVPKGASDERKSLDRLMLSYQQAMAGARQSDQLRAQEKAAMGWMSSGDPDLVAKGVRALGRNVRNQVSTIQAGYTPQVQQSVHDQMGNPLDSLSQVYDDNKAPKKTVIPPAGPTPPPATGGLTPEQEARRQQLLQKSQGN